MSTSSRNTVLTELRTALPESAPIPDLPASGPWHTFDDPFTHFSELLAAVGGSCLRVSTITDADAAILEVDAWASAVVKCSLVSGIGHSNLDVHAIDDPHQLETIDFAILPGEFGVAENGAIWVTDEGIPHCVLFFLPQHLSIVIPSSQIVHNMHEAYARIEPQKHAFSGFISGPSKTADIEQSLVIGAHGARSLTVLVVDEL